MNNNKQEKAEKKPRPRKTNQVKKTSSPSFSKSDNNQNLGLNLDLKLTLFFKSKAGRRRFSLRTYLPLIVACVLHSFWRGTVAVLIFIWPLLGL